MGTKTTFQEAQGAVPGPKWKVSDVVFWLKSDLNMIDVYFRVMQPHSDVDKFLPLVKPDSEKELTPARLKSYLHSAGALPNMVLATPGLVDVMAQHIVDYRNSLIDRYNEEQMDKAQQKMFD